MRKLAIIFTTIFLAGLVSCKSGTSEKKAQDVKKEVVRKPEDVVFGNPQAPYSVFMYASYLCDFCRYFFSRTFPELEKNYLEKGALNLVVKWVDFNENPQMLYALQAASCIARFGVYEKYHRLLMVNPDVVFTGEFMQLIDDIMEDNQEIAQCVLQNGDYAYLRSNVKEFRENNFSGTPTFVLNNHAYSGFISYDNFKKLIKKEFNLP